MVIFSSLVAALREGYRWVEFLPATGLHRVERDVMRGDGKRVKMMAFARPEEMAV